MLIPPPNIGSIMWRDGLYYEESYSGALAYGVATFASVWLFLTH